MSEPTGLYVHLPFCKSKCPYCDFFSVTAIDQLDVVLKNLDREARLYAHDMDCVDSVYIGGGTPSLLSSRQLIGLLETVSYVMSWPLNDETTEFTVEINPADVNSDLLKLLQSAGVNRLSLGVQSFDDNELRILGRRHDKTRALEAISTIRTAGFAALGLDLIFGLPDADLNRWRDNLIQALSFAPEHISCYALSVAAKTPFGLMERRGKLKLPDENLFASMFLETSDLLQTAGYEHYEVSNFARQKQHRSRHNQKYWRRQPYLGLGPGAHSFDGKKRWWNVCDLDTYIQSIQQGRRPIEGAETIDPAKARLEAISLGLRTSDGVPLDTIHQQPGHEQAVVRLLEDGLAVIRNGRLCPTCKGFLLADGMAKLLA